MIRDGSHGTTKTSLSILHAEAVADQRRREASMASLTGDAGNKKAPGFRLSGGPVRFPAGPDRIRGRRHARQRRSIARQWLPGQSRCGYGPGNRAERQPNIRDLWRLPRAAREPYAPSKCRSARAMHRDVELTTRPYGATPRCRTAHLTAPSAQSLSLGHSFLANLLYKSAVKVKSTFRVEKEP